MNYLRKRSGFTLIELLTVIAIIAILMAIIIPGVGAAQTAAKKARTRAQYSQYAQALEGFKAEYKYYPILGGSGGETNAFDISTNQELFIEVLTGRTEEGERSISEEAKKHNKKGLSFYSFSEAEFNEEGNIVNAFDGTEIFIRVDHNLDGLTRKGLEETGDARAGVVVWNEADPNNKIPEVKTW